MKVRNPVWATGYGLGMVIGSAAAYSFWGFSPPGGILILAGAGAGGVISHLLTRSLEEWSDRSSLRILAKALIYSASSFSLLFGLFVLMFTATGKLSVRGSLVAILSGGVIYGVVISSLLLYLNLRDR
jgi:hypothetical protein